MANDGFNGSTVSFMAVPIGHLRGISYDSAAPEVSVTGSSNASQIFHAGITKADLSVDVVGSSTIPCGSAGSLTITWFDSGTAGTLTKAVLVGRSIKGNMDGEITSTLKFANTTT